MKSSGVTLLETLIAVLMLGVGLIAIAGVFPMAGSIQRRTYDDMVTRQVGQTVEALVYSRGFAAADLADPTTSPLMMLGKVFPVSRRTLDPHESNTTAIAPWSYKDRAYPSFMANDGDFLNRHYYWVPLVRKPGLGALEGVPSPLDWQVFVFVLKKEDGMTYGDHSPAFLTTQYIKSLINLPITLSDVANPDDPAEVPVVRLVLTGTVPGQKIYRLNLAPGVKASDLFQVGDLVLTGDGTVRKVTYADARDLKLSGGYDKNIEMIWYAQRVGNTSPTRDILVLGGGGVVLK